LILWINFYCEVRKLKTKIFTLFLLITATGVFAGETDWQNFMLQSKSSELVFNSQVAAQTKVSPAVQVKGLKSPKKALFMSAFVPGSGEAYAGKFLKTAGFLALEAAGWALYITQNSKGNDIDAEFKKYADAHWTESVYWDWIAMHSGVDRNDMDALRAWEHDHFSHGLHEEKDQQYYEMIGKYDQFNYAWDDSDIGLLDEGFDRTTMRSKNRLYYEERRNASNQAFKNATKGLTIVLFNHILSALDAAWTVNRENKKLTANMQGDMIRLDNQSYAALTLKLNW